MASSKKPNKSKIELNVTSLLDVVFQLIIFFLLVTNFSSAELPELIVPEPVEPQSRELRDEKRVVVNVIPDMENLSDAERKDRDIVLSAKSVRVGNDDILPHEYSRLTELLKAEKEKNPDIYINLRADARIRYQEVGPVIKAITMASVKRVNMISELPK